MKKRRFEFKRSMSFLIVLIFFCGTSFAKEVKEKELKGNSEISSKPPAQGCCRIKMTGGGYDYFVSTEDDCVAHRQFHSFMKERTLCFESFPE
ncbi:LIC_11321 family protein [Leptospira alexanderi]